MYDQGNVKATQTELGLFLSEFSNNRGDLKLGDNALFIQGICQSDQGDYDIAKETFSQLFTSKSTGRLMADMARLQRASLTSPIDQGSRDLIESEYSEEFANINGFSMMVFIILMALLTHGHGMSFQDRCLGFVKRPCFPKFMKMVAHGAPVTDGLDEFRSLRSEDTKRYKKIEMEL